MNENWKKEEKFKMTKFRKNDSGTIQIRYETLPSGKVVAFGIAGTDLSVMQFNGGVDFDKESDEILKKLVHSKTHHAFQYTPDVGFTTVDINQQQWFTF